jgi:hypothetical protein
MNIMGYSQSWINQSNIERELERLKGDWKSFEKEVLNNHCLSQELENDK